MADLAEKGMPRCSLLTTKTPSSRAVLAGYVLPGDVSSLTHAFSTIFQGLRASGCGLAAANAWLFLARSTSPAAWRGLVRDRKAADQLVQARDAGPRDRRERAQAQPGVVHELATHGALTRLTPENGYRGYVPAEAEGDDIERSYGLCFGPAIEKYDAFAEAAEAERQRSAETAQVKEALRAAKGELRDRLKTLAAMDVISPLTVEAETLLASLLPSTGCRKRQGSRVARQMHRLLSIPEAAKELGVPTASLRTAAGRHGFLVKMGWAVRIVPTTLPELIKKFRGAYLYHG